MTQVLWWRKYVLYFLALVKASEPLASQGHVIQWKKCWTMHNTTNVDMLNTKWSVGEEERVYGEISGNDYEDLQKFMTVKVWEPLQMWLVLRRTAFSFRDP